MTFELQSSNSPRNGIYSKGTTNQWKILVIFVNKDTCASAYLGLESVGDSDNIMDTNRFICFSVIIKNVCK